MPPGLRAAARLVLLAAAPLAGACASPLDSLTGASADQMAGQAFANLDAAKVTHLTGGFQNGGRRFTLDCTTDHAGDAQGTISVDGRAFDLLVTGGRTFVRGQGFWASYGDDRVTRSYGDSWVALQAGGSGSLAGPGSPCTIGQTLRDRRLQLQKGGTSRIGRQEVVELSDSSGRLYVTSGKPTQLVRMVSSPGYRTPDGSSDVRLDFDHPKQLQVTPPPGPFASASSSGSGRSSATRNGRSRPSQKFSLTPDSLRS